MKKLAIIAALTLAIGASVTAGTMAKYSQTLEDKTATVQAKGFGIDATHTPKVSNISPGETFVHEFTISNTGEVNADAKIEVNLGESELLKVIENGWNVDSKIVLKDSANNVIPLVKTSEGNYSWNVDSNAGGSDKYSLEIYWVDTVEGVEAQKALEVANTSVQGKSGEITIKIAGTQK